MIEYRGILKEVLTAVFEDHPDCYVVIGVSWLGAPKLTPWAYAIRPIGYIYTGPTHTPTGVAVAEKQMDDLEMYYMGRFSTNLKNILNVYDKDTDPDLVPLQTY